MDPGKDHLSREPLPVVNFANILQAVFLQFCFAIKIQKQSVVKENLYITFAYKTDAHKMLRKLRPARQKRTRA